MARHPWVTAADRGIRFGVQLVLRPESVAVLPEIGREVERLGYDALFIMDHPAVHPEPWVCLGAVAAATTRLRLGSMVNCAPYRHPLHLARLGTDLDHLSGGRFVCGLGIGWLATEFQALEVALLSAPERQAALEETIAIVNLAWTGERFSFVGVHHSVVEAEVIPAPVQRPRPPIVIGGGGERVTLRQVARLADACNIGDLAPGERPDPRAPAETTRRKLAALRAHCDAVGRPYDEILRTHFTLNLVLAPTEAALAAKVAAIDTDRSLSPGTRRSGREGLLTGLPEQIVAFFQARVEAGMQYFVVQLDAGDRETLTLLATEVMPRVS